jgi:hypothetical protein
MFSVMFAVESVPFKFALKISTDHSNSGARVGSLDLP